MESLIPLVLLGVVFYFLLLRPQRQRQRQILDVQAALAPGVRVVTTAGLYATVVEVSDDAVMLEVAPGVVCRYAKLAVARIVPDEAPAPEEAPTPESGPPPSVA